MKTDSDRVGFFRLSLSARFLYSSAVMQEGEGEDEDTEANKASTGNA
jgi:hypothetical protein